ncbi:MAG: hypothetical protein VB112_07365 [Oscillospiraceae bacterium]|nr:hypothetical protein [Oscillospiraceae bacterium]
MDTMEKQIRDALISAIKTEGLDAVGTFENTSFSKRAASIASVGIESFSASPIGMNDYLGQTQGSASVSEVYGKRAVLTAAIDVYTPKALKAAGCGESAEKVYAALAAALSLGLRAKEINTSAAAFDTATGMFRQRVSARMDAYFTAQTDEYGLLLDFELKGVIRT